MHLRDHPLMHSGTAPGWPPVWTRLTTDAQVLTGEIGVLKKTIRETDGKCCLVIDYDGAAYFGSVVFDDVMFCGLIYQILKEHVGQPLTDIGDLDLSFSL